MSTDLFPRDSHPSEPFEVTKRLARELVRETGIDGSVSPFSRPNQHAISSTRATSSRRVGRNAVQPFRWLGPRVRCSWEPDLLDCGPQPREGKSSTCRVTSNVVGAVVPVAVGAVFSPCTGSFERAGAAGPPAIQTYQSGNSRAYPDCPGQEGNPHHVGKAHGDTDDGNEQDGPQEQCDEPGDGFRGRLLTSLSGAG